MTNSRTLGCRAALSSSCRLRISLALVGAVERVDLHHLEGVDLLRLLVLADLEVLLLHVEDGFAGLRSVTMTSTLTKLMPLRMTGGRCSSWRLVRRLGRRGRAAAAGPGGCCGRAPATTSARHERMLTREAIEHVTRMRADDNIHGMAQETMETLPSALTVLAEDEALFRDSVREFAQAQVRPLVREMDEHAKIPAQLVNKLFDLGVMGIEIPETYGGAGRELLPCRPGGRGAVARRSLRRRARRRPEHAGHQRPAALGQRRHQAALPPEARRRYGRRLRACPRPAPAATRSR